MLQRKELTEYGLMSISNSRIYELDALRGIAALMVVIFHYNMLDPYAPAITRIGVTGVDLFFLISGFVIFQSANLQTSAYKFLVSRSTRLYPNYWFAVLFTFSLMCIQIYVINGASGEPFWNVVFWNLSMFQSFVHVIDLDGPYWTLVLELVFYLYVTCFLIIKKIEWLLPVSVAVSVVSFVIEQNFWGHPLTTHYFTYFPTAKFISLFTAGMTLFLMSKKSINLWIGIVLIIGLYLMQCLMVTRTGRCIGFVSLAAYKGILACYFGVFLLLIFNKLKWIVNPTTLFFGKISYSLYLIHQYVSIDFIIPNMQKLGVPLWLATYFIALPFCILLAWGMTWLFDNKIQKITKRWLLKIGPQ